jgi:hypothetical protein
MTDLNNVEEKKFVSDKIQKLVIQLNEEISKANELPSMKVRILQNSDFGSKNSLVTASIYETVSY